MSSRPLACAVFVSSLIRLTASSAYADLGDCGQPLTTGADPVASDCLFILRAAVNLDDCATECICDTTGAGGITAPDALACLRFVVGGLGSLACPCDGTTTTTLGGTTTTTPSTTSTTLPSTSSTTNGGPSTTVTTTTSSTTTTTVATCGIGGVQYEGSCWFVASGNLTSCDAVCTAVERTCDETATRDVAGSGGSLANCSTLVELLVGEPDQAFDVDNAICAGPELGIGCAWYEETEFPPPQRIASRVANPATTCAADGENETCSSAGRRICACVE